MVAKLAMMDAKVRAEKIHRQVATRVMVHALTVALVDVAEQWRVLCQVKMVVVQTLAL